MRCKRSQVSLIDAGGKELSNRNLGDASEPMLDILRTRSPAPR
ncbi:MAG TPA: hypothetical protein VHA57_09675 [Actinomycetota bacterium]|nr:hypothetical protein [Actinomycetota bacterium]